MSYTFRWWAQQAKTRCDRNVYVGLVCTVTDKNGIEKLLHLDYRMSHLGQKWVVLAPNGTNPGLYWDKCSILKSDLKNSRICPIWSLFRDKCRILKSDLKKLRICPIWGQSDSLWVEIWHSGLNDKSCSWISSSSVPTTFNCLPGARWLR